jgi:hypothetical protein
VCLPYVCGLSTDVRIGLLDADIDFGHFLGNFKSKFGFRRERAKFVVSSSFRRDVSTPELPLAASCRGRYQSLMTLPATFPSCRQGILVWGEIPSMPRR